MPYHVSGLDCSAEGMERLRYQDEFILLAYGVKDSTVEEIADDWQQDIQSCDRFENFDYDAARAAVEEFVSDYRDTIQREIDSLPDDFEEDESACFRLYVTAPSDEEDDSSA